MIVKMSKYTFVLYHKRQKEFLEALQQLGLVDITTTAWEADDEERAMMSELDQLRAAKAYLKELASEEGFRAGEPYTDGREAFERYREAAAAIDDLGGRLEKSRREAEELAVWGEFSPDDIRRLGELGVTLRFFSAYKSELQSIMSAYGNDMIIEPVAEKDGRSYFIVVQTGEGVDVPFDAQEYKMPDMTAADKSAEIGRLEMQLASWREVMARVYASTDKLEEYAVGLKDRFDFTRATHCGVREAENTLVIMEGWATEDTSGKVDALLEEWPDVVYIKERPTPQDDTPVVLKNNKFANPFEVIGQFYALPKYGTIDLTAFFGPFYMIFFGFCLGDAGYGLLLVLASFFLRRKKTTAMKQIANLTLLCGAAAVVFGFLAGSFFGVQLAGLEMFSDMKAKFLDTDMLFTLSLALGGVQIVFGLVLNVINTTRQYGFKYSLGTLGWLLVLLGGVLLLLPPMMGLAALPAAPCYTIMGIGGILMLFLNNPNRNPLINFGSGLWDTYNNVTGLLGDILSYIRLFALCLSGGTLALVFNDLAFGLTEGLPIVARQIVILVILVFGHSINLFMSALGAFVHPMRLTFVEFYKNAGFESTQREFTPLRKNGR